MSKLGVEGELGVMWFSNLGLGVRIFPNLSARASGEVCVMQKLEGPVPHTRDSRDEHGCEIY